MFKYNCLNAISEAGLKSLSSDFVKTDDVNEAEAILVRSAAMHDMEFSDNLLAVARAGAGVNNIPLDKCAEKGIVVFNTPGANANGVKELVIAAMILTSRNLIAANGWVNENKDDENIGKTMEKAKSKFAGREVKGKKLGVIGLGAIGVLVANAASSLGMEVIGCDPFLSVQNALNLSRKVKLVKEREEVFRGCDYITVHVPLLDDTKEMINADTISMMKDGVIILNFARDLLVKEDAVIEGLASGKIAGYATDFPSVKLANTKGVVAFPHLGASTTESEDNCAVMAAAEITDYLENGNIRNSVNFPACDMGVCSQAGRIAVLHKNVPNIISGLTTVFGQSGINIDKMMNQSRGEYAYSIIDIDKAGAKDIADEIATKEGILKVRVIK
ncbi:phosphoglycerate dehydrogenase [Eshraghiella crossota]|jgi:D-3-phosphoglycerate dehydrogenase|uniref:phosphoglycerate dehydrogenase n=1 Tax=Eshraghiella crossota TaxID=45851 RepID=UPI000ED11C27|nr:3-phosphoglycerate dehydrogenase [Butyrivibrio crossotus]MBS6452116.1 phosphoglycerate dehydrogenase [Butyrivibrio sp.]MCI7067602.1 phosphoglycerate dehydrogenase [Butyrivibrio crossotus]HAI92298.1 3-phosphoglycerate dehydrogenase [Butyrivibrio sp.]